MRGCPETAGLYIYNYSGKKLNDVICITLFTLLIKRWVIFPFLKIISSRHDKNVRIFIIICCKKKGRGPMPPSKSHYFVNKTDYGIACVMSELYVIGSIAENLPPAKL